MSDTPIRDAVAKLDSLPVDQVQIGAVADQTDIGAAVEGRLDVGKPGGWSFAASASWWKTKGYQAAAFLRWKGRDE
jgi:hypothetical protein